MTPLERVMNRLEGKPVDRVPNLSILMAFAARHVGQPFGRFCTDYRVMAEANLLCCREFGIDMLNTMSDAYRETADFGARVTFPADDLPIMTDPPIRTPEDVARLEGFDIATSVRCLDRVNAVRMYKDVVGDEFAILGWVECPFAEAADLRGLKDIMMDIYDSPRMLADLLEIALAQGIEFARHQVDAGAHFIGMGDAVASLVSPKTYRELVLPYERRLIDAVHSMGARVKLHICGNITALLPDIVTSGADIVDVDWMVPLGEACRLADGRCSINGNFDPVSVVMNGTPQAIETAVEECLAAGDNRLFISPGCEVPRDTPPQNLLAIRHALERLG